MAISSCHSIYIVDLHLLLHSIVGARACSKFHTFHIAMLFAQEYGILAASEEDRPFVPISQIVIEGTPAGLKTAFRKWDARKGVTKNERGKEVVLPLHAALEAVRR